MRRQIEPDYWIRVWDKQHPQGVVRGAWVVGQSDDYVRLLAGDVMLVLTPDELNVRVRQAEGYEERVRSRLDR